MRSTRRFWVVLLGLSLGCGPVFVFPGGRLSGDVAPAPADWAFTDAVDTVQLETRPADPYSVNIWGTAAGGAFYVAGRGDSRWIQNAAADPAVRLRVDGTVYELRAVPVDDDAELGGLLAAMKKKYDFEPDPEDRASSRAFRLEPRTGS